MLNIPTFSRISPKTSPHRSRKGMNGNVDPSVTSCDSNQLHQSQTVNGNTHLTTNTNNHDSPSENNKPINLFGTPRIKSRKCYSRVLLCLLYSVMSFIPVKLYNKSDVHVQTCNISQDMNITHLIIEHNQFYCGETTREFYQKLLP